MTEDMRRARFPVAQAGAYRLKVETKDPSGEAAKAAKDFARRRRSSQTGSRLQADAAQSGKDVRASRRRKPDCCSLRQQRPTPTSSRSIRRTATVGRRNRLESRQGRDVDRDPGHRGLSGGSGARATAMPVTDQALRRSAEVSVPWSNKELAI